MTTGRLAALALALALIAAPALAQQAGAIDLKRLDPEADLVEALIVDAPSPGPAWWKVSDADTTVYVLGVPALTPSQLEVDSSVFKRRVDGANVLIMGQEADVSVVRIVALALGGKRYFLSQTPMRQTLPPALRARLEARLVLMKEKPDSLDEVKPAFAGFVVGNSEEGKLTISLGGVTERIRAIARGKDIARKPPIKTLAGYSLVDAIKTLGTAPEPLQELCLEAGLNQADAGGAGIKTLAERWARGEVREVVSADRGFSRCLASTPSIAAALRSGRDEAVAALAAALKKPGKAVAVIELRSLLAQDGVLERLRGQGFKVSVPGE